MNWVLILVFAILAIGILQGYRKGLLRMVYSMVSWILVWVCVVWSKPYINQYLVENTTIYEKVVAQCEEQVKRTAEKKAEETIQNGLEQEDLDLEGIDLSGEDLNGIGLEGVLPEEHPQLESLSMDLSELGIQLPESVVEQILEKTSGAAGEMLEASGIYTTIAQGLADFVLEGISFFIAFIFAGLLVAIISQLLGIVSHIPILKGVNRTLGLFAGGICSLMIIWVAFYVVALCSATEWGTTVITYIYQNPLLIYLYENNLILTLILHYL